MRSYYNGEIQDYIEISEDYNHIVNVMRLKVGDNLTVFNGSNYNYETKIVEINKKSIKCKVINKNENKIKNSNVTVFQALLKGEKLDYLVQKLTEINVEKLVLFESEFTISKWKEDKLKKLEKISIEACKQCGRSVPLKVEFLKNVESVIKTFNCFDYIIFAYEKSDNSLKNTLKKLNNNKVCLIVGSEGGFSENEANLICDNKNVNCVSLGETILRAETASLTLAYATIYENILP